MMRKRIFPLFDSREVANIVEDIDVSSLDSGHVLPNIGNPAALGIWFPAI